MKNVLIIDDCDDFREVVADLLKDEGFHVVDVAGPELAHEEMKKGKIDVVLCDLVMPMGTLDEEDEEPEENSAMVGVHAIHSISKEYPDVPVIAMSGQMEGQPLQAMQVFGAVDTISKPFGREQLLRVIENALRACGKGTDTPAEV